MLTTHLDHFLTPVVVLTGASSGIGHATLLALRVRAQSWCWPRAAIQHFGRIDIWINNLGIGAVGAFDATPMEAHEHVIAANLLGQMNGAACGAAACAPTPAQSGWG